MTISHLHLFQRPVVLMSSYVTMASVSLVAGCVMAGLTATRTTHQMNKTVSMQFHFNNHVLYELTTQYGLVHACKNAHPNNQIGGMLKFVKEWYLNLSMLFSWL